MASSPSVGLGVSGLFRFSAFSAFSAMCLASVVQARIERYTTTFVDSTKILVGETGEAGWRPSAAGSWPAAREEDFPIPKVTRDPGAGSPGRPGGAPEPRQHDGHVQRRPAQNRAGRAGR